MLKKILAFIFLFEYCLTNPLGSQPHPDQNDFNEAVIFDNIDLVKEYLDAFPFNHWNKYDDYNANPIHYVSSVEMAELLLEHGADKNLVTEDTNSTLLDFAIQSGLTDLRDFLLENKATLDNTDSEGKTPIVYCIEAQDPECVENILPNVNKSQILGIYNDQLGTGEKNDKIGKMLRYENVDLKTLSTLTSESSINVQDYVDLIQTMQRLQDFLTDADMQKITDNLHQQQDFDKIDENLDEARSHSSKWNVEIFPKLEGTFEDLNKLAQTIIKTYNEKRPQMKSLELGRLSDEEIEQKLAMQREQLEREGFHDATIDDQLEKQREEILTQEPDYEEGHKDMKKFLRFIGLYAKRYTRKIDSSANLIATFQGELASDLRNFKKDRDFLNQVMKKLATKILNQFQDFKKYEVVDNENYKKVKNDMENVHNNILQILEYLNQQSNIAGSDVDETPRSFPSLDLNEAKHLKVLNINMWGLRALLGNGSKYRKNRFKALVDKLNESNYDVVLLQEVWLLEDSDTLITGLSESFPYHASSHPNSKCQSPLAGVTIENCAGLMILSKHYLSDIKFTQYEEQGLGGPFGNYEDTVGKGVLQARLTTQNDNITIDVFNTHLVSYSDEFSHDGVRANQMTTLIDVIKQSDAHIKIFGGDLNAYPIKDKTHPYGRLTLENMVDSFIDRYPDEARNPKFATYGKNGNTFTGHKDPKRIDYLMHWCDPNELMMSTVEFKLADFKAKKDNGDIISITDHEPLHSEYVIIRPPQHSSRKCMSNPCKNNGLCTDTIDDYSCRCQGNFYGKDCQTEAVNKVSEESRSKKFDFFEMMEELGGEDVISKIKNAIDLKKVLDQSENVDSKKFEAVVTHAGNLAKDILQLGKNIKGTIDKALGALRKKDRLEKLIANETIVLNFLEEQYKIYPEIISNQKTLNLLMEITKGRNDLQRRMDNLLGKHILENLASDVGYVKNYWSEFLEQLQNISKEDDVKSMISQIKEMLLEWSDIQTNPLQVINSL